MAADIIIHKATKVPVGKDQEQHLEMARTFGNRFNRLYNHDYFPEPYAFNFSVTWLRSRDLMAREKWANRKVKAMPFTWG
jgi:tryptophanyl-tRNA synthetase